LASFAPTDTAMCVAGSFHCGFSHWQVLQAKFSTPLNLALDKWFLMRIFCPIQWWPHCY